MEKDKLYLSYWSCKKFMRLRDNIFLKKIFQGRTSVDKNYWDPVFLYKILVVLYLRLAFSGYKGFTSFTKLRNETFHERILFGHERIWRL